MPTKQPAAVIHPTRFFALNRQLGMAGVLCNGVLWAYVLWRVRPNMDPAVLHYTIYFGIDRVGEWWQIYFLPFSGLIIIGMNAMCANVLRREPMISVVLFATALVSQIILGLAVFVLL